MTLPAQACSTLSFQRPNTLTVVTSLRFSSYELKFEWSLSEPAHQKHLLFTLCKILAKDFVKINQITWAEDTAGIGEIGSLQSQRPLCFSCSLPFANSVSLPVSLGLSKSQCPDGQDRVRTYTRPRQDFSDDQMMNPQTPTASERISADLPSMDLRE